MAAPNYTQSRPVIARQITFVAGDKTKAQQGKVVYTDGMQLKYDKATNIYYVTMPINTNATKVDENSWIVTDDKGVQKVWDNTTFLANHV